MKKKEEIDFRRRNLLFIDLETTGLDIDKHEIIEIGCLLVSGRNFELIREYYAKVNPDHLERASKEGLEVSGYKKEKWRDAKSLKEVLREIVKIASGAMIAGWKVDFDWWFLKRALERFKIDHKFDYHLIDVISLAYKYFHTKKEPIRLGLRKVAPHLGVDIKDTHDAMGDVRATYEVFKKLMEVK